MDDVVENWDPDLQKLAAEYGPGMVITAFKVSQHLKNEGYPGIHFKEKTENHLRKIGPRTAQSKVSAEMRKRIKSNRNNY